MKKMFGLLALMTIGHVSGQCYQSWYMKRRLMGAVPLLESALTDLLLKMNEHDLSRDEIQALVQEELAFIKIAISSE